jgi:hypothetical protein
VINAHADIFAGIISGAALADNDVSGNSSLAIANLNAQAFGFRIAAKTRDASGFFMCHIFFKIYLIKNESTILYDSLTHCYHNKRAVECQEKIVLI